MDPDVQKNSDEIWAILRETAALGRQTDLRMEAAERRAEAFERRAERNHQRAMERLDKVEQNHAKLDHHLQVTAELVRDGMVMMRQLAADTRELKKFQKAFLSSYKNGGNGRGRH